MKRVAFLVLLLATAFAVNCDAQVVWESASGPLAPISVQSVAIAPNGSMYVGTAGNGAYRSRNHGVSWDKIDSGLPTLNIQALCCNNQGYLFAGTQSYNCVSTDEGNSWTYYDWKDTASDTVPPNNMITMCIDKDGNVYSAGETGSYRTTNNGKSWAYIGGGSSIFAIAIAQNNDIFIGNWMNHRLPNILRTTDNGQHWEEKSEGLPATPSGIRCILPLADNHLLTGTYGAGIYRSTNDGESWTNVNGIIPATVTNVLLQTKQDDVFAGTNLGSIYRSSDDGLSWLEADSGCATSYVTAFAQDSDGTIYAGNSGLFRSTNNGDAWTPQPPSLTNMSVNSLTLHGSALYAATAGGGGLFRSSDFGKSWYSAIPRLTNYAAVSLITIPSCLLVGFDQKGIYRSSDKGISWSNVSSANASNFVASSPADVYSISGNRLCYSHDSGKTWQISLGYEYDKITALAAYQNYIFIAGETYEWDRWHHEIIATHGGLLKSADKGFTWDSDSGTLNLANESIKAIGNDTQGSLFASLSNGIYRSIDFGDTWKKVSDVGNVSCFATDSNGGLFAFANAKIIYSKNSGDNWIVFDSSSRYNTTTAVFGPGNKIIIGTSNQGAFRTGAFPIADVTEERSKYSYIISNSPNPFTHSTTIHFTLPSSEYVRLIVYDAQGREVSHVASAMYDAGEHEAVFDAEKLPPGVYFYRLTAGGESQVRAMVLE
jgi:photosystem II stability/assembly factor-like uncharacterized protein